MPACWTVRVNELTLVDALVCWIVKVVELTAVWVMMLSCWTVKAIELIVVSVPQVVVLVC